MRELWYWGRWKEPTPDGFSFEVVVVCTSREAVRRHHQERGYDDLLFQMGEEDTPTPRPPLPEDGLLFDEGDDAQPTYERRYKLVTFHRLVETLREDARDGGPLGWTLLINPGRDGENRFKADGIYALGDFLSTVPAAPKNAAATKKPRTSKK